MASVQLFNTHKFNLGIKIEELLTQVFNAVKQDLKLPDLWWVELEILNDEEIQNINKEYRNKDHATDVISFSFLEDASAQKESLIKNQMEETQDLTHNEIMNDLLGDEKECHIDSKLISHNQKTGPLHNQIGVIYICHSYIKSFSAKSFEQNFSFLFLHGYLHILGYEHGDQMSTLEHKIMSKFF